MHTTAPALTEGHIAELDREGFVTIPGFFSRDLTTRFRAHIDAMLPPVGQRARVGPDGPAGYVEESRGRAYGRQYPPGAIIAETIFDTGLLSVAQAALMSDDLRLGKHFLHRNDPGEREREAYGWHADAIFPPAIYAARSPRLIVLAFWCALSSVEPGGGAFTLVPRSHRRIQDARVGMEVDDIGEKRRVLERAQVDITQAIELCSQEGDLTILDPVCLHSPSRNTRTSPRYIFRAELMDGASDFQREPRIRAERQRHPEIAPELIARVPREHPRLLEDVRLS